MNALCMKRIFPLCAVSLLLCGCMQNTSAEPETAIRFTGEMPEQLTWDDLRKKGVWFDKNADYPYDLDGAFVDNKITDADDAFRAVASVAALLGIRDFKEEIRFYGSRESHVHDIYVFSQYYQDIPVMGTYTVLHVDPETKLVEGLMNGYIPDISISTEPKLSADEAIAVIQEEYHVNAANAPQLVLSMDAHFPVRLAWYLETDSDAPCAVWLDAKSGDIIYAEYPEDYFGGA